MLAATGCCIMCSATLKVELKVNLDHQICDLLTFSILPPNFNNYPKKDVTFSYL